MATEPPSADGEQAAPPDSDPSRGVVDAAADDSRETDDSLETDHSPETPDETPDFEGPRRRARREREERRAAEQRARAIEEARLQAKRKVVSTQGADQRATLPKGAVRGLKAMAWSVLVIVTAVVLGVVLYFTPVMSARSIAVVGIGALTHDEVVAAAGVTLGTPLLQIDTDAVARRVADIRRVASARVQREYPSTLRITVVERVAVAIKDYADGAHLFDRDGVDFGTVVPGQPAPTALPYLDVDNPGPSDPPTMAALQVLTSLRPEVAAQVGRIAAPSVASITLTLVDGRVVIWGDTERTDEKADKLAALLTQPGQTYDVSSPDLPTIK